MVLRGSTSPLGRLFDLASSAFRWRLGTWLVGLLLAAAMGRVLIAGYLSTCVEVHIHDGGQRLTWHTHQSSVAAVLREVAVELGPEDIVSPALASPVQDGDVIRVLRARRATVFADGQVRHLQTHAGSVEDLLREVDLQLNSRDWLTLNGEQATLDTPLYGMGQTLRSVSSRGQDRLLPSASNAPIELSVHRAIPIRVDDDGELRLIHTTHQSVGMALLAEDIALFLGDEISPALDASVSPDMEVVIGRSHPVKIASDGKLIRTRTQATTVGQVLAQEGVTLVGLDYTLPPEDAPLPESEPIRVVRARRAFVVEEESIPYETVWLPDPELDLDHQRLEQEGQEGVHRWRYDMLYENGLEVVRNLEDEWIAREPTNKAIAYGTKITVRELETPDGTFEYWRRIKMLATSYTAATCGKTPDHPLYGITRLGWQMRHGIVAVDPSVIGLRSQVYVPGYGEGVAGDTGGGVRGQHIDLGYDEDNLVFWYKWVDVYVLTPIPPLDQIRYVLPNWPRR
jgi:uncharacterized protein YabE (DUF348 family)